MELFFGTIVASQKASLAATASFTDGWLSVVQRLTQLNIDVTRANVEKTSEMALLIWDGSLSQEDVSSWNAALQSGIEQFSEYCHSVVQ